VSSGAAQKMAKIGKVAHKQLEKNSNSFLKVAGCPPGSLFINSRMLFDKVPELHSFLNALQGSAKNEKRSQVPGHSVFSTNLQNGNHGDPSACFYA
jgi:hypothetical protein